MRFPSLLRAARAAAATAGRFPLVLGAAAVAAFSMVAVIEGTERALLSRIWATALVGLPLLTAVVATAERYRLRGRLRWVAAAVVVVGLGALGAASQAWPDEQAVLRFVQLGIVTHLAVAVIPYSRGPAGTGFWQWNRHLLLRFAIAGLYTAVLWIGLALALAAVDRLLGIRIRNETYPQTLALLAFVFHPWFTLSGIPDDFERLDSLDEYPPGLKVFAQFVLLPLVTIYLLILTAYLGKVLVTRVWPSGWIGWLVSGVSAVGVFALLLLHPVRDREDARWVNAYGRWFFLALLPALGMLLVAIGKRIGQYGVTEPRYFLLILAVWLVALAVYYVITGSRHIRPIPITLGLVGLVAAGGPWSAQATSRRSQLRRMDAILVANEMGRSGAPRRATRALSEEDGRELSAVLRYLRRYHGSAAVAAAVGVPADSVRTWAADSALAEPDRIETAAAGRLGVDFVGPRPPFDHRVPGFSLREPVVVDIAGFDLMRPVALRAGAPLAVEAADLVFEPDGDLRTIGVTRSGQLVLTLDLAAVLDREGIDLGAGAQQRSEPLVVEAETASLRVRLVLEHLTGRRRSGASVPEAASGYLLIDRRP